MGGGQVGQYGWVGGRDGVDAIVSDAYVYGLDGDASP